MISEELKSRLARCEFMRLRIELSCELDCEVTLPQCLSIRSALVQVARELREFGEIDPSGLTALLDPPLSSDPEARKRFQKPSPPFVVRYAPELFGPFRAGDSFSFELILMGEAMNRVGFMIRLFELLAGRIFGEEGAFEQTSVTGWDDSGNLHPVWESGDEIGELEPPICSADWWVTQRDELKESVQLDIVTPARLLAKGKPLFRPDVNELVPYLLRRVTSMCYANAGVMLLDDVQPLLQSLSDLKFHSSLEWCDWRELQKGADIEVGGLMGQCELHGGGIAELAWVVALGELFQFGRGASYGAGRIVVRDGLTG